MTDPIHDPEEHEAESDKQTEEQFRRQMSQAAYLLAHGNGEDAIILLERCFAIHPDDVDLLTNLGGAYILAGHHRYAIPVLERASELDPGNPAIWSNLAAAYLGKLVISNREGQDRALSAYRRVIEIEPDYPNVHYNMGLIFIDRREWDEAYDAFTRAIKANPHDTDAHAMRARVDEIRNRPSSPEAN